MLILYDINHTKICGLTNCKEFKLDKEINQQDTLSFQYPISDSKCSSIEEECYIRTEDNEYVVKEVNAEDDDLNEYVCKVNVEDLTGNTVSHFETVEQSCTDSVNLAIAGTGWTIGSCDVTKLRTVRKNNCSSYDILVEIQTAYGCEMTFDSINKQVNIYKQMGSDKGAYFAEQLNLKKLTVQRNSYDYITRLIPIGKDGLDITSVNGGINYIENHQYSAKVMAAYWEDNRYAVAQDLYDDAVVRLDYLSKPLKAYKADILDLVNLSDTYKSVFDYDLGDTITLLSKSKGTKEKQRIIKHTSYPDEPERNTVEIANKITSLEQLQVRFQDTSDTVDDVTTTAGEVDGSKVDAIDYSKIQNVSIGTADIQDAAIVTVKIGSAAITTEKVADSAITTAKIENAAITTAKIANAAITTALIADAAINSTQIADGSITDAKIVNLTADKITAGTLSVQRLVIIGSDQSIVFAINEANGTAQLSQTTIDGGSLTQRSITADRIVTGAITANEMAANTITANSGIIASIDASKITTGTLDASLINVVNLSASSITSGAMTGVTIQTGTSGGRIVLNNSNFTQYDANGHKLVLLDNSDLHFYGYVVDSVLDGTSHEYELGHVCVGSNNNADTFQPLEVYGNYGVYIYGGNSNGAASPGVNISGATYCNSDFTAARIHAGGASRLNGGADLNSLTQWGEYDVNSPANGVLGATWHNILNCPSADSNYITQFAFTMTGGTEVYFRQKMYGTWNGWNRLWHSGNASLVTSTNANGYDGITTPNSGTTGWVRTTQCGFIPYASGGASGLGTQSWPFSTVYGCTICSYRIEGIPNGSLTSDMFGIGTGNCRFDTTGGSLRLYISAVGSSDYGMRIGSDGTWSYMAASSQKAYIDTGGNFHATSKSAITYTIDYGEVITYADESPNHVFNDRGIGQLDANGYCAISLDPIMTETVNTENSNYYIQLTGISTSNVYIKKDGLHSDYFEVQGDPGAEFFWQFTAERYGYEGLRWNDADLVF